jgi:hypothetical protein
MPAEATKVLQVPEAVKKLLGKGKKDNRSARTKQIQSAIKDLEEQIRRASGLRKKDLEGDLEFVKRELKKSELEDRQQNEDTIIKKREVPPVPMPTFSLPPSSKKKKA